MTRSSSTTACLAWAMAVMRTCVVVFCLSATPRALAGEIWVSTGVGGSRESLYSYAGVTLTPMGTLQEAGWRARLWGKGLRFNDGIETSNTASSATEIHGIGADAELGWQFVSPDLRAALYAGGVWRDEAQRGERFGASLALDAQFQMTNRWRILAAGKYTFGFDETWGHVKSEFRFGENLSAGLLTSTNRGRGYSIVRAGGSLGGFNFDMPLVGRAFISVDAGIEYNATTKNSSPFGALHLGFPY